MANVAINDLRRIGRATLRQLADHPQLRVVGANDLTSLDNLIYLLRYDSVYGRSQEIDNEWGHAAQMIREAANQDSRSS